MVQEREAREARAASFAADAERARRRDSATVLADLRRETERERAPGPSETDPERAPGPPDANGSRDVEDRESATARYIDAATGRVETVAQVAEALAARAVEATLERATLDDRRSASGNENRRTENESPNHGPSLLRLQLRAVATLLDAQRRKHAERLAALHARYLEVDVRREAQDRLLRFAEAEDDVRAASGRLGAGAARDAGSGTRRVAACSSTQGPTRRRTTPTRRTRVTRRATRDSPRRKGNPPLSANR